MDSGKEAWYSIGELARRSGVSVKTIRHYSDVGVLPPSRITEAGYRMYSGEERSRLELIRTLRAAGFGLADIGVMLEDKSEIPDAIRLQLETVDFQLRNLRRRRRLLESALEDNEVAEESYPDRAHALGLLEAREREAFLAEHLEKGLERTPVDNETKTEFWRAIVSGMPEELNEEQLAAWTELAQLASDDSFLEALRKQTNPVSTSAEEDFDPAGWNEAMKAALDEAKLAVRGSVAFTGKSGQRVVRNWIENSARAMGERNHTRFAEWLLSHHEHTYEPRMERYWKLIAILKQWEYDPAVAKAYGWLIEGLRWRVSERRASFADEA